MGTKFRQHICTESQFLSYDAAKTYLQRTHRNYVHKSSSLLPWASEGGGRGSLDPLDFVIISKKWLFFQFRGVKSKFHHFLPPGKKYYENPLLIPPGKTPSDAHAYFITRDERTVKFFTPRPVLIR